MLVSAQAWGEQLSSIDRLHRLQTSLFIGMSRLLRFYLKRWRCFAAPSRYVPSVARALDAWLRTQKKVQGLLERCNYLTSQLAEARVRYAHSEFLRASVAKAVK